MKKAVLLIGLLFFVNSFTFAQESGNRSYATPRRKPQINSGVLVGNAPGGREVYYVEANVSMNMKADEYLAVFGLTQEAPTAAESNNKVNAQATGFLRSLEALGIKRGDAFIDFITQNKVYDYTTTGAVTTEKLSGFQTKKNVAVRYRDRDLLEKITAAAVKDGIFDLIKIDYLVSDIKAVHARLFEEAVRVIKQQEANYANAFGIRLAPTNFANEKYDAFYPGEMYANYQAFEAGSTYGDYNNRVIQQRKTKTFYYEPLDPSDFDSVINPLGIEPMVQFTLYLRMQYDLKK